MVRISLPAAALTGVMHDRIASPFLCTVQAPHRAMPQPNFVPVSPRMSRTYHNRGILGSPSKGRSIPFTLRLIIGPPFSSPPAFYLPREKTQPTSKLDVKPRPLVSLF